MQNFAFVKAAFILRIGTFRVEIPKRDAGYSVCCPSNLPQTLGAKPGHYFELGLLSLFKMYYSFNRLPSHYTPRNTECNIKRKYKNYVKNEINWIESVWIKGMPYVQPVHHSLQLRKVAHTSRNPPVP